MRKEKDQENEQVLRDQRVTTRAECSKVLEPSGRELKPICHRKIIHVPTVVKL